MTQATNITAHTTTLTVKDLGKRFNREWIFRRLNAAFSPGNTYAITGPNGSGKSTLLQVLWGQMPPSTGTLSYQINNQETPVDEVYRHLSMATPYMDLIEEFTLREQLSFHFRLRPSRNNISIDELIDILYLGPSQNKTLSNFSSGMRQRVKLALAFYTEADMVFLDEPGTNLDRQAFTWYLDHLAKLPPSCTVFVASNNAEEYPNASRVLNILDLK